MNKWGYIICLLAFIACQKDINVYDCEDGNSNVKCVEQTPDDQARVALDNSDWDTAIKILKELTEEEPDVYGRFTLLSAAYAGKAGFRILDIASAQFSGGGSFVDQMGAFLPDKDLLGDVAYTKSVSNMGLAVDALEDIPAAKLATTSAEEYASSGRFQLSLYQSAYSVMFLNQFSGEGGDFSEESLQDMSEEDAILVIENLQAAAAQDPDGPMAAALEEALAGIESQDGATDKEKLADFLAAQGN